MTMTFQKASLLAKKNPGSTLKRGLEGGFVVELQNGTLLREYDDLETDFGNTGQALSENEYLVAIEKLKSDLEAALAKLHEATERERKNKEKLEEEKMKSRDKQDLANRTIQKKNNLIAELKAKIEKYSKYNLDKLEEEFKKEEKTRIMGLVSSGGLPYKTLVRIHDGSGALGLNKEEIQIVWEEMRRTRPPLGSGDCFVVHSGDDD